MIEPEKISEVSKRYADKNLKFRTFLKNRADPDELDRQFGDLHNEIFVRDEYDCCKCANCCKIYDIRIEQEDIHVISKRLGQTESGFINEYLVPNPEETGVFALKDKPCLFLDADGKCRDNCSKKFRIAGL